MNNDTMRVGGSRIDPMLIDDSLYRAKLYSEIRNKNPLVSRSEWTDYEISPGETLSPPAIALRHWQDESLSWVVRIAAEIDDPRREMESGRIIALPSITWLRDRIRYYQKLQSIKVA